MPEAFGKPTFVRVGKKRTPKLLAPPSKPRPPTETGNAPSPLTDIRTYTFDGQVASSTTHDWLIPSGTISGDGILVFVFHDDTMTLTPPSGYTLLEDQTSGQYSRYVYWKVSDGTETDTTFSVTGGGGDVCFMSGRIPANGATLSTPEVVEGGSTPSTSEYDPPAISPAGAPGTYHIVSALMMVKGDPQPDAASAVSDGYTLLGYIAGSGAVLSPKLYVQQKGSTAVTTTEDPGIVDWSASAGSRNFHSFTIAVDATGVDPDVVGYPATTADISDIATATALGQILVSDGDSWETLAVGTNDQVLTADSGEALGVKWADASGGSTAVNDLTDATITSVADGELFVYDSGSGEWINQTLAEAGVAAATHTHTESDVTDLDHWTESDHDALDHSGLTGVEGYYEVIVSGSAPPVAVTNEAEDDWLYGLVP